MSEVEFRNQVDSLAKKLADEFTRKAIESLDEATRNDEDAFREAMRDIEYCLKGEMPDIIREAEEEARMMLGN